MFISFIACARALGSTKAVLHGTLTPVTMTVTNANSTTIAPVRQKLSGYDFYRQVLGSPRYIVAPMVDQSEHAWRVLSRRYGGQLCYTPMFHARMFSDPVNGHKYRAEQWSTDAQDRPLIVQFCANEPEHLLSAAKLVESDCDAVDLNLGCPQHIAKRGHYGSFLQDEWDLVHNLISTLNTDLSIPVTAKIRVFPTIEKTVAYAKMIERAGAQMLVVHGRLRDQKGHKTGLADWDAIRAVKQAITSIPVIANGNILYHEDLQRCLDYTGCDGVMTAEGNLYNPAILASSELPHTWAMAEEYLGICREFPTRLSPIRAHLFKILQPSLPHHTDLRTRLSKAGTFDEVWDIVAELKVRLMEDEVRIGEEGMGERDELGYKKVPYWRCQPYFRPELPADNGASGSKRKKEVGEMEEVMEERTQQKKRGTEEGKIAEDEECVKKVKEFATVEVA
ncbi:dihydrouridine synthase-domain-containing protein [Jimgerdemannia flammicorona]|nr:dihydrouridine synthase-domain-containing protein [Jimgerdemannia flammicorona]